MMGEGGKLATSARTNEMIGCALTCYPFVWKLGVQRSPGIWIATIGPVGLVVSWQRPFGWAGGGMKLLGGNDRLRAENERLRAALENIRAALESIRSDSKAADRAWEYALAELEGEHR